MLLTAIYYTIFVPARAHEAFPCFDQPDLKARYALTIEVPEDWEALSNGEALDLMQELSHLDPANQRTIELTELLQTRMAQSAAGNGPR